MTQHCGGLASPMMGPGAAGVGAGGGPGNLPNLTASPQSGAAGGPPLPEDNAVANTSANSEFTYRARAQFAYKANPEDPNEISFEKGELLEVLDKQGKWWQTKRADGTIGIAPSNYLQLL